MGSNPTPVTKYGIRNQELEVMKILEIEISKIKPNPHQPRKNFDPQKLRELAASIKFHGFLQPLVVNKVQLFSSNDIDKAGKNEYELIVGQRRLEAAKILGLKKVPVIIREPKEQEKLELALIENIQRKDLNSIERARAYQKLQERFNLTQAEIAKRIGKARATITNSLRLLTLPEEIKRALAEERINEGQAKIILSLKKPEEQINLFRKIIQTGISVRDTERKAKDLSLSRVTAKDSVAETSEKDYSLQEKEAQLREVLGTKVEIQRQGERGEIVIGFYSEEELEEIIRKIVKLGREMWNF